MQLPALQWLRRFSCRRAWGSPLHFLLWVFLQNKRKRSNSKDRENPKHVTQRNVVSSFSSLPKFWRVVIPPRNWTPKHGPERCEATFRVETPGPKSPKTGDHLAMNVSFHYPVRG